jgi:aspartyl-tRNA(Asn)/glutamyl-tRNA(Gln) amidotransferase subunit C
MSETTHIDIDYVAKLSRLTLTDEEKKLFASQLEDILQHFEKLKEIDVDDEEPMAHPFPVFNVLGEDEASPTLTPEEALANAPKQRDQQLVVPKVVDDA